MTIADSLSETPVSTLDLTRYVRVTPETTVAETIHKMTDADRSCACVVDGEALIGVFTQRDVLVRALGRSSTWDRPIADEMSSEVRSMGHDQTVSNGLAIMVDWWVRNVPVLDEDGHLVGNLSFFTIMRFMAQLLEARLGGTGRGADDHPGLLDFVDFTGLNVTPPVVVRLDDPVSSAAHHMRARGIGSVLVADDRGHLAGVVTEFDLQTKVGCDDRDLSSIEVRAVMSDPMALTARASIAEVIGEIADRGDSNIPLVAESGRPAAVASFRDVAAFIESALDTVS